jgi:hypothetical protein
MVGFLCKKETRVRIPSPSGVDEWPKSLTPVNINLAHSPIGPRVRAERDSVILPGGDHKRIAARERRGRGSPVLRSTPTLLGPRGLQDIW